MALDPKKIRDEKGITDLTGFDTDDLNEGATNLYFTDERVDDRVSNLVIGGDFITVTYNDVANTLTFNWDGASLNDLDDVSYSSHTAGDLFVSNGTNLVKLSPPPLLESRLGWKSTGGIGGVQWIGYTAPVATEYDAYTCRKDSSGTQTSTGSFAVVTFDTSIDDSGDITYSGGVFTIPQSASAITYEIVFTANFKHSSGTGGGIAVFQLEDDDTGSYASVVEGSDQYLASGRGNVTLHIIKTYNTLSGTKNIRVRFKDLANPCDLIADGVMMKIRTISDGSS